LRKNGQAVVEFVVGIVAVVILVAGMVQLGLLAKAHSDAMTEARKSAAKKAVDDDIEASPDYVGSVQDGPDKFNYSADDEFPDGNKSDLQSKLLVYANPNDLQDYLGDNALTSVYNDPAKVMNGFVKGNSSKTVSLLTAIQNMITGTGSFDVKSEVWMVSIGDIQ